MAAKTYRFTLRLDEEQEQFVKEVAGRLDMTVPEVVRGAVDNLAMTLPTGWESKLNELPPETLKTLNMYTEQIRRIGVNMNGATRTLFRMAREFERTDYRLSRDADPNTLVAIADDLEAMARDVAGLVEKTCRSQR